MLIPPCRSHGVSYFGPGKPRIPGKKVCSCRMGLLVKPGELDGQA